MPFLSQYLPPGRFTSSATAPTAATEGDVWLNEDTGVMYTYYVDANGFQWVEFGSANVGVSGPQGATGVIGPTGATGPVLTTIPQNAKSSTYTLTASDSGKHISISAEVNIPANIFSAGEVVTIYNNSSVLTLPITPISPVTLRLAGSTTTGSRSIVRHGICTILCVAPNEFVIFGAGLT